MPPHTSAYLLHHSNLVFNLYARPTSPSVSEHQEWTTRHLSSPSFSPCSQLCLRALGQRCGSGLSRSHREAGVSLCTASHSSLYIANSDAFTCMLQDKELLCTPVRHMPHFGSFNLMQGCMLCALLQLALPPLLKWNGIQIGNIFFQPIDFYILETRHFCSREFAPLQIKANSLFASKKSVETLWVNTSQSSPLPEFSYHCIRSQWTISGSVQSFLFILEHMLLLIPGLIIANNTYIGLSNLHYIVREILFLIFSCRSTKETYLLRMSNTHHLIVRAN